MGTTWQHRIQAIFPLAEYWVLSRVGDGAKREEEMFQIQMDSICNIEEYIVNACISV